MARIDDLGRAAGLAVMDEAARAVDVERELERVRAGHEAGREGGRVGRGRTAVLAIAAVLVVAMVVTIGVVFGREGRESIVTEDPPEPSAPPTQPEAPDPTVDPDADPSAGPSGQVDALVPVVVDVVELDLGDSGRLRSVPAAVSPDGRWIAHQGANDAVCLTSLTEATTAWCEQIDGFQFGQLSWSPDGTRFTGGDDTVFGQEWRTVVVDLDGSWETLDLAVDGEPGTAGPLLLASFAGDGRSIVGVLPPDDEAGVPFRLALVDASSGATRVQHHIPVRPEDRSLSRPCRSTRTDRCCSGPTARRFPTRSWCGRTRRSSCSTMSTRRSRRSRSPTTSDCHGPRST